MILISFFVGTNKYQISSFKVSPNFITFSANVTREFEQTFSGLKPKIFRITNFNEEVEKVANKKEAFSTSLFQTFSLIQKAFFSSIELLGKKFQKLAYDSNKFIQDMFQMKTKLYFFFLVCLSEEKESMHFAENQFVCRINDNFPFRATK